MVSAASFRDQRLARAFRTIESWSPQPADWADLSKLGRDPVDARVQLRQVGGILRLSTGGVPVAARRAAETTETQAPRWNGVPLAELRTAGDVWEIETGADEGDGVEEGPVRPSWATEFGRDQFGWYAVLHVGDVQQKARWMEPGSFDMGSPETEEGRWDDEGPVHRVHLTQGFWLWDTPCTESLWNAAIPAAEARDMRSGDLPVVEVNHGEATNFCERLSKAIGGTWTLPTEAQWEYACRATCQKERYGPLDEIAWHDGNTSERQPVGRLRPNDWGLYDMLGNVWEWCRDAWGRYEPGEATDPLRDGQDDERVRRVMRGGAFYSPATDVRAAYRYGSDAGYRWLSLGFRALSSGEPSGAPKGRIETEQAKPAESEESPSGAELRRWWLEAGVLEVSPTAANTTIQIRTCSNESWKLSREECPSWATSSGFDADGLWASIVVGDVRQRMRWIAPGRFLMGDAANSPGPKADFTVINRGFWLFDTPCTQGLWQAVMGENPSQFKDLGADYPVESVNVDDVERFLHKLSQLAGIAFQLPNEQQWEYACRAGTDTQRYEEDLDAIAWYGNSGGSTQPVGRKRPNAWGLFDTLGNVYEWCADPYEGMDKVRVLRGGAFDSHAALVRAAFRCGYDAGRRWLFFGFRALSFGEPAQLARSGSKRRGLSPQPRREGDSGAIVEDRE